MQLYRNTKKNWIGVGTISLDVATNVAREFLELVDKHFPPSCQKKEDCPVPGECN